MIHFLSREDLLQWLEKNCTRKAVVRALQEGLVEHLGAFTKLGPNGKPGWIVQVTSAVSPVRAWDIEIIPERKRCGVFIRVATDTPWEYWDGIQGFDEIASEEPMPLYDGDNPDKYWELKNERKTEIAEKNRASKNTESEPKSEDKKT